MSNISLASLDYISREELASQIQSSKQTANASPLPQNLAVVDVRDSDHIGGHIRGSTWVPSNTLDYKAAELVRTLKDKEVVVFHCALSQQRGPAAALRYLREKERLRSEAGGKDGEGKEDTGAKEGEDKQAEGQAGKNEQKVVVLRGGFTEWQEKFGSDERLTEGWKRDIWEM